MVKCFECFSEVSDADGFCPNCGIRLPSGEVQVDQAPDSAVIGLEASDVTEMDHDSASKEAVEEMPLIDHIGVVPSTPLDAEVFSVEESEAAVPSYAKPHDAERRSEDEGEFVSGSTSLSGQMNPEEEEVVIGTPNVAIVGVAEGEEQEEDAPIEAEPEEFLPDEPDAAEIIEHVDEVVLDAEIEEDHESEFEGGSDAIIEITPELRPQMDVPSDVAQTGTTSFEAGVKSAPSTGGGSSPSKLKPLDEGTLLSGRYEIAKKIGGGGMGAVYLAHDRNLGGAARAVKEMVQSYIEGEQQEKAINDFKRESLLLTTLDHQSIPTIYDYFFDEEECRFYLVMKYISGGDLAGRLRAAPEGRIEERVVTEWAIELADVLDYLHRHDPPIVYRDLKPANVMIDGNSGRVMLIDFGIARWINKEEKGVTAVGTMGYAPPELFSGNVEPRSDIYSLGSTMFQLLTGADPQSNPLLIFDFDKNPRPRQINPRLSEQMEAILMRAVQYNSTARFNSAAEMREVLENHLASLKSGNVTYGQPIPPPVSEPSKVFCGFCGKPILPTDMFCAYCGSQQTVVQGVTAPTFKPKVGTVRLHVMGSGGLDGNGFKLDKDVNLVGRRDPGGNIFPEVDLSKYDPTTKISRRHAQISRTSAGYIVEDLGSSNGTFLTREGLGTVRLAKGQMHDLKAGDTLKLGDTTLQFILE